ncbi:MAG: zinc-binding dehydrogenase, partial [Pseudomonadota bacterium]
KLTSNSGVDAVVDMVGTKDTLEQGIKSLGRGGTLVMVAVPRGIAGFEMEASRFVFDEIVVTGCRCATRQEIRDSLTLVKRGIVRPAVLNTFPISEANRVQKMIDNMALAGRTAFVFD